MVGNISEQWLPRLPAHSGLRTANPIWVKAVPELASTVCTWSGITGKVMRMDSMVNVPFGYYRIGSNPEIFVKIIPIDHSELQLRSDKMAAWLENQNISVSLVWPRRGLDLVASGHLIKPLRIGHWVFDSRFSRYA